MTGPNYLKLAISIAGLNVEIKTSHPAYVAALKKRYGRFISSGKAQIRIQIRLTEGREPIRWETLQPVFRQGNLYFSQTGFEGSIHLAEGLGDFWLSSAHALGGIEYVLRSAYALLAFQQGGLLFHAAAVVRDGVTFLFFGPSGVGKTTITSLAADESVLNDDLVLLLPEDGAWTCFATPFWNPGQRPRSSPIKAPLQSMLRLEQDREVFLERMSWGQAIAEVVASSPIVSADPGRTGLLLRRTEQILTKIQVYRLHFLPDLSFWEVLAPSTPVNRQ